MATFTGSTGGGGRVPYLDVTVQSRTSTEAVLRFTFRSNPVSGYSTWGTFQGTLDVYSNYNNSHTYYSITGPVTNGASNTIWSRDITFKTSGAFGIIATVAGSIPGTSGWTSTSLSGSMNVAAGAAKPGAVSSMTFTRSSGTAGTVTWPAAANATSYSLWGRNGTSGSWTHLAAANTSRSVGVTLAANTAMYYYFTSVGAGGTTDSGNFGPYYGTPNTPAAPTLASGGVVSWSNNAAYVHGAEVQRTDNGGSTTTQVALGAVSSWTDPTAQQPLTQYRVRVWAGPSADTAKTFSEWSDWSESAMAATYKPPQITAMSARRCNSAGTLTETGRYLRVTTSGTVSSVKNASNAETNTLTRKIGYRKRGATAWTETTIVNGGAPNNWANAGITIGSNLIAETDVWEVRATVQDAYSGLVVQQVTVPVSQVALSLARPGIGVGKTWDPAEADGDVVLQLGGDVAGDALPSGMVVPYAGTTAPDYWLVCDGSAVSRTTYKRLFAAIGTTYGAGNGSTTFNVPDLRGRVAAGYDSTQIDFNEIGKTGGATTHTLTIAELAAHTHNDQHDTKAYSAGVSTSLHLGTGSPSHPNGAFGRATTGGNQAHNNLQPYMSLNYIIKT